MRETEVGAERLFELVRLEGLHTQGQSTSLSAKLSEFSDHRAILRVPVLRRLQEASQEIELVVLSTFVMSIFAGSSEREIAGFVPPEAAADIARLRLHIASIHRDDRSRRGNDLA